MNQGKAERILLKLVRFFILAALFVPLIYTEDTLFPFIVGKIVYFQAVIGIAAGLYLMLVFVNPEWRPRLSLLLKVVFMYIVVLFISTVMGVDFSRSFWANFERMTGWYALLHYFLFFVIAASVFPDRAGRTKLLKTMLIASLLVSFSALYSLIKPGFLFQMGTLARLAGSLGNSIYLGNYMLASLFLAGILYFEDPRKSSRFFVILVGIINFFVFVSAETRGAMLGLLITVAIAIFFILLTTKNKKVRFGIAGSIIIFAFLAGFLYSNRDAGWMQKIPGVRRLVSMSLSGGTMATRYIAWNIAFDAWKERPVFGWGPENFYYAFNKYYNPKSLEFSYYETWFDRAHNVVFDHLVFGGVFGLLAYLAVYAAAIGSLFKYWRRGGIAYIQFIFAAGFFVAMFVQKLTVFDEPSSYLVFFVGLACAQTFLADQNKRLSEKEKLPQKKIGGGVFGVWALIILIFFTSLVYFGSIKTLLVSKKLLSAIRISMSSISAAIPAYKEVLAMGTAYIKDVEQDYGKEAVRMAQSNSASKEDIGRVLGAARDALQHSLKEHPRDVYGFLLLGQLDFVSAYYDPQYIGEAEWAYSKAAELSPKRQQIYYDWGKLRLARQDFIGASELYQRALDFNRNISDSYWYLGFAQYNSSDKENALKNFEEAARRNYQWKSPYEPVLVGDTYFDFKKYEEAIKYYEISLAQSEIWVTYFRAAKAYAGAGDRVKARSYARKAIERAPENEHADIQKFLNAVK